MRLGTVCSGIGAPEQAGRALGWRGVWASEIDSAARAVFAARHPRVELLGDMLEEDWDARRGTVDVLAAGTPCQSFSVAGKRAGLADARGDLTRDFFARVVPAVRPRWVVWENVPGVLSDDGGRTFGAILGWLAEHGYGWAWRVLDAQWWGVAQRRRRLFLVGCAGGAWQRAAAVLLEPESMRGGPAPSREEGARVAATLAARARSGSKFTSVEGSSGGHLIPDLADPIAANEARTYTHEGEHNFRLRNCVAYGGNNTAGPLEVATAVNAHGGPHGRLDFESETFIAFDSTQITSRENRCNPQPGDACHPLSASAHPPAMASQYGVRRLTPTECERLMGLPDGYTAVEHRGKQLADGHRYRCLGNSIVVPVLAWAFTRIDRAGGFRRRS